MSLDKLKKDELQTAVEYFGGEYEESDKKADLLRRLDEDGVTWEMYKASELYKSDDEEEIAPEEPKAAAPAPEKNTLVKMNRANPTFEVRGYRFTRQHPFVPTTEDDADWIVENVDGFAIASPKEVREFYS